MKIDICLAFCLLPVVLGRVARPARLPTRYDEDPIVREKSRVSAYVITDEGLKIECWEIGELLPQTSATSSRRESQRPVHRMSFGAPVEATVYTIPPNTEFASVSSTGVHVGATDFRIKPILYTVKSGILAVTTAPSSSSSRTDDAWLEEAVFSLENGDDWFYFEDDSSLPAPRAQCTKNPYDDILSSRTASGGITTILAFQHEQRPPHKVLHGGRCNFAGLKPVSSGNAVRDYDGSGFRYQDL